MAVFWTYKVAIPKEHITIERQKDGKPARIKYVIAAPYNREKGYAEPKRTLIGYQCMDDPKMMHPTTQYREIFPDLWKNVTGETVMPTTKRIGLFSLCQALNQKTGIKDLLDATYGPAVANGIMDYAIFSIRHHSDSTFSFENSMKDEMLYSETARSDSWYSSLFEHQMSKAQALQFRKDWAIQCKNEGVEEVWLCIDGSNDDCKAQGVELAEKGNSKSGKNVNIVSFTYAVTESGLPVTFDLYQGGIVDAKALKKVVDFLSECGIRLRGIILDRGYCDGPSLRYLNSLCLPYIIMVKGCPDGVVNITNEYGAKIRLNAEYLVEGTHLFGAQQEGQLFSNYKHLDTITLFYDYQNGGERISTLLDSLYKMLDKLNDGIRQGEFNPKIPKKYETMIDITEESIHGEKEQKAVINRKGLQAALDSKGLYAIVSSEKMTPTEIHHKYVARNASEKQFMFVKAQLGYGTARIYYTNGVYSKFLVGFVAAVLRYEIESASLSLDRSTTQMIREVDLLEMQKINDFYTYTHAEKNIVSDLFSSLGADALALLNESVKIENDRLAGKAPVLRHRKPGPKKGSHHKNYDADGNVIRMKPGVKPGTKRSNVNKDGTPRKKPGVQTGSTRSKYNKDGSLRKKPGPKPGSHHKPKSAEQSTKLVQKT